MGCILIPKVDNGHTQKPYRDGYESRDVQVVDMRGTGYPGQYKFWAGVEYMHKGEYPSPENHLLRNQRSLMWGSNWEMGLP